MKSHKLSLLDKPVELSGGHQLIGHAVPKPSTPAEHSVTCLARSHRKEMALLGSKAKSSGGGTDEEPRSLPWDQHELHMRRNRAGCIWKFDRRHEVDLPLQEP